MDTAYIKEFFTEMRELLAPYLAQAKPLPKNNNGPSPGFGIAGRGDPEGNGSGSAKLKVFIYMVSPENKSMPGSCWVYFLNKEQKDLYDSGQLSLKSLEDQGFMCTSPASPGCVWLNVSFDHYLLAVKRSAPEKVIASCIVNARTIQPKLTLDFVKEPWAVALYLK